MKKTILNICVSLLGVAGFYSCNVMDTKPFDAYSEDLVWGSKATADAFVYNVYADVTGYYHNVYGEDQMTLNSINCSGNGFTRELIEVWDDYGFGHFGVIRKCNLIIEKAQVSSGLAEGEKKELVAEGKMLRAMMYYYEAKRFGRFVWVDRVLSEGEPDFKFPSTADPAESYGYIVKDLDDAIAGLPEQSQAGRLNKYAACAIKSEVCLQAYAYTNKEEYLTGALEAANKVINEGGYSMDSNYGDMFTEVGAYSSPEIIFAIYRDKSNTRCDGITELIFTLPNMGNDHLKDIGASPLFNVNWVFEGWCEAGPSQNLVDDYLVIDERNGQAVDWDESSQFQAGVREISVTKPNEVVVSAGEATGEVPVNELMYENRDKRFYASIVYDSCSYFGETVTTREKGNLNRYTRVGGMGPEISLTNYYWRKGVYNVSPRVYYDISTNYHWVVTRLGRVYLNKAEALLCLAKLGKASVGDAVAALNETRTVHGGLPRSTASSLAEAWKDYKRERHVELAWECDYYWSLLRWGKYGYEANDGKQPGAEIAELTTPATFIEISHDRKSYFIGEVIHASNNDRKFDARRRYLLPIPQGQIDRNPNLKPQNPNW